MGLLNPDDLPQCELLGAKVHGPTLAQTLDVIEGWLQSPQGRCRFVVATGFHGLSIGANEPAFLDVLNSSDLFCPDGIAAVWLARLKGVPFPSRVTGGDIFHEMILRSAERGYKHALYGDSEETLARLVDCFPQGLVAATLSPPFRVLEPWEEEAHVEELNASSADIIWVALGCPRQENWIARNQHRLTARVAIGVGAAFRFEAGLVRRAPDWIGRMGFEWVWRLMAEPRKMWRRDLFDGPKFLVAATRDIYLGRFASPNSGQSTDLPPA